MNSSNVCRICLSNNTLLYNIFELVVISSEGKQIPIHEMLAFCCSATLINNFPQSICSVCVDSCMRAYGFITLFRKNNDTFERIFGVSHVERIQTFSQIIPAQPMQQIHQIPTQQLQQIQTQPIQMMPSQRDAIHTFSQNVPPPIQNDCVQTYSQNQLIHSFAQRENQIQVVAKNVIDEIDLCKEEVVMEQSLPEISLKNEIEISEDANKLIMPQNVEIKENNENNQSPDVIEVDLSEDELIKYYTKHHLCPVCKKYFLNYNVFAKHMKIHPNEVDCNLCSEKCATSDEFQKHYFRNHYNYCNICKISFVLRKQYDAHQSAVHNEVPPKPRKVSSIRKNNLKKGFDAHKCPSCLREFISLSKLVKHVQQEHQNDQINCRSCEERFSTPDEYLCHYGYRHYNHCHICDLGFNNRDCFLRHQTKHEEKPCYGTPTHKCPICSNYSTDFSGFVDHIYGGHKDVSTINCLICDQQLTDVQSYLEHYKSMHQIKCELCNNSFTSQKQFDEHINHQFENAAESEPNLYKHSCPICKSLFSSFNEFRQHICNSHADTENAPLTCPTCYATVKNLQDFCNHYEFEHFIHCSLCSVYFTSRFYFEEHNMLKHKSNQVGDSSISSKS